jgi:isopenicillin N synthase-like dioxygenase
MAKAVDFSKLLNGPDWQRTAWAEELTKTFEKHGYVKLFDHGIPDDIVDGIFPWVSSHTHLEETLTNFEL